MAFTLGLAVSVDGIIAPILCWLADDYGLSTGMHWIACVPLLVAVMAFTLTDPDDGLTKKIYWNLYKETYHRESAKK